MHFSRDFRSEMSHLSQYTGGKQSPGRRKGSERKPKQNLQGWELLVPKILLYGQRQYYFPHSLSSQKKHDSDMAGKGKAWGKEIFFLLLKWHVSYYILQSKWIMGAYQKLWWSTLLVKLADLKWDCLIFFASIVTCSFLRVQVDIRQNTWEVILFSPTEQSDTPHWPGSKKVEEFQFVGYFLNHNNQCLTLGKSILGC